MDRERGYHDGQYDDRIATIALIDLPHPTIPNLYQHCFEYLETWQWSPETERVGTGQWFFAPERRLLPEPLPSAEVGIAKRLAP
jgi:hypothetical protein